MLSRRVRAQRSLGAGNLIPLAKILNSGKRGCATPLVTMLRTGVLGQTWARVCFSACFHYKVARTVINTIKDSL